MLQNNNGVAYYLMRSNKCGKFSGNALLAARGRGQIRETDAIRRSGSKEWLSPTEFDWLELERLVSAESSLISSSGMPDIEYGTHGIGHEKGLGSEKVPVASLSTQSDEIASTAPNTLVSKDAKPDNSSFWWNDPSCERVNVSKSRLSTKLLLVGGVSLTILGFFAFSHFFSVSKTETAFTFGPFSQSSSVADDSTNSVEEVIENDVLVEKTEPVISSDSIEEEVPPATPSPLVEANTVPTLQPPVTPSSFNTVLLPEFAYPSVSLPTSDLDQTFSLIVAKLKSHLAATQSLSAYQKEWLTLSSEISECTVRIRNDENLLQTANPRIQTKTFLLNQYYSELRLGITGREDMVVKKNELEHEITALNMECYRARQSLPNLRNNLLYQTERLKKVMNHVVTLTTQERVSQAQLMEAIDFFGEEPLELHRRIKLYTESQLGENPEFLLGYLVHGYSCLILGEQELALRDAENFQTQVQLIPDEIRLLRNQVLPRYLSLMRALAVHAKGQKDGWRTRPNETNMITDASPDFAEAWLLRGMVEAETRTAREAEEWFRRAIRMKQEDPRIHRIVVRYLQKAKNCPPQVLSQHLKELVSRSTNDWRSWYVACQAGLSLGDTESAQQYFSKIPRTEFSAEKLDELSKDPRLQKVDFQFRK